MTKARILIIDDSEVVLAVAKHALVEAGHEVELCANPLSAAHLLRRLNPDLVLIDVNMPAINGDVVTEVLNQHMSNVPVVLHSDIGAARLEQLVERTGALGFISKTTDRARFVQQVESWLITARNRARP